MKYFILLLSLSCAWTILPSEAPDGQNETLDFEKKLLQSRSLKDKKKEVRAAAIEAMTKPFSLDCCAVLIPPITKIMHDILNPKTSSDHLARLAISLYIGLPNKPDWKDQFNIGLPNKPDWKDQFNIRLTNKPEYSWEDKFTSLVEKKVLK